MGLENHAVALAGGIVVLTFHIFTHGHRLKTLAQTLGLFIGLWKPDHAEPDAFRKARHDQVEEELWKVRARTYTNVVSWLVHIAGALVIAFQYELATSFCLTGAVRLFCMAGVYTAHTAVLTGVLVLTPKNLTFIYSGYYASFVLFILSGMINRDSDARAMTVQVFNDGSRLVMSVVFMHTWTAIPFQLAMSVSESAVYWVNHDDNAESVAFAMGQVVSALGIIGVSATLEYWVSSHITALLDAESMVASFRRMLRGVCDGEVLLTENMDVSEDAECLKHLLMLPTGCKGRNFERLLMADERDRFKGFIKQSTEDALKLEERRKTPHCLRVSLLGANDIRVGVDLWHVPMPHVFGKGPHHLVALREDWEARTHPEATSHVQRMLPKSSPTSSETRAGSEAGYMSQSSYNSLQQNYPELVDMTLLVDGGSHWLDVEQAHLRFVKQPSDPDACMPSIRRLVRPTDWESVRSRLSSFMREVSNSEEPQSLHMKLRMMDEARRTVIANDVDVSAFHPPRIEAEEGADEVSEPDMKICLQLSNFAFDDTKKKTQPSLMGITELEPMEDEECDCSP